MTPIRALIASICLLVPSLMVYSEISSAQDRLAGVTKADSDIAIASVAHASYCTEDLKRVLKRVLQSCGLLSSGEVRGCRPADAQSIATMAGDDFNALFTPIANRAGIVQFIQGSSDLDAPDFDLMDKIYTDQRGASYFLVVARASPEGSVEDNAELSERRAKAVLNHIRQNFPDPDLDKQVGLLWLGEEYAQLGETFCNWRRSGEIEVCGNDELNRSAFMAWIDCRL